MNSAKNNRNLCFRMLWILNMLFFLYVQMKFDVSVAFFVVSILLFWTWNMIIYVKWMNKLRSISEIRSQSGRRFNTQNNSDVRELLFTKEKFSDEIINTSIKKCRASLGNCVMIMIGSLIVFFIFAFVNGFKNRFFIG